MKQTLFFKDDRSDKVYIVEIVPEGHLFHVNFAFGKRIGTKQTGCKTSAGPVPLAYAQPMFEALVNKKIAEGYQPGDDSGPIQYTNALPKSEATGMKIAPMLLNAIDETEALKLIADDDWLMQPKFDGERVQLHKSGTDVRGYSRKKLPVSLPKDVIAAALAFSRDFVLDGELIGDLFVCFDILQDGANDLTKTACTVRAGYVTTLWPHEGLGIVSSPIALTTDAKQAFYETLRQKGAEGAVFKRKSAFYKSGRPASGGDARKLKFWATASVIVSRHNKGKRGETKRSVGIRLFDGTEVGNVTIAANQKTPPVGSICEVRYLYCHDVGGKLIQTNLLRVRNDIDASDCTADQFEVKGEERE